MKVKRSWYAAQLIVLAINKHNKLKFACNDCKRLVHYKCSKLTASQIRIQLDIKRKKKRGTSLSDKEKVEHKALQIELAANN